MGPAGVLAILAGWFTTEIGRQPWVVYNVMRTADGVSAARRRGTAASRSRSSSSSTSLVFGAGIVYMLRLIAKGPAAPDASAAERRRRPGTVAARDAAAVRRADPSRRRHRER